MGRLIKETTTTTTTVKVYEAEAGDAGLEGASEAEVVTTEATAPETAQATAVPALVEAAEVRGGGEEGDAGAGDAEGEDEDEDQGDIRVRVNGRDCYCPPRGARARVRGR